MSVRRLAEPAVQPAAFAFNKANAATAKQWLKKYPKGREQSAVIPLLMIAQEQEGWVTKPAIEHIADMLDMPYIRALEVATFYTQFQLKPVGTRAHVQVCGTTPCMLRGSEDLISLCKKRIHPNPLTPNDAGKGADVKPGPQIDRIFSAPVGGPSTLLAPEKKAAAPRAKKVSDDAAVS